MKGFVGGRSICRGYLYLELGLLVGDVFDVSVLSCSYLCTAGVRLFYSSTGFFIRGVVK